MTWTYDTALTADKDKVRLLIGDTDTTDQQLSNEEITWLLSSEGSIYSAAAMGAETLAAKYARFVDKSVGSMSLSASQKQQHYSDLAKRLRSRDVDLVAPYAGGISIDTKDTQEEDEDRVIPAFSREMMSEVELRTPTDSTVS